MLPKKKIATATERRSGKRKYQAAAIPTNRRPHPSTSHAYDYTADESEFLRAVQAYKETRRRPHPTWCEVLDIVRSLGYRKVPAAAGALAFFWEDIACACACLPFCF